ncbi:MAG: ferritin-like domain-containing protein [Alphaproteobacteria bacterium]|nr:ferritin-like domain-containing protein [Alphaproteobacteria bacterium]
MKALLLRAVPRRALLSDSGKVLSLAGLTALVGAGVAGPAFGQAAPGQDVQLLNAAIALEHEGIAAYTIAAGSGLLKPEVVKIGVTFRGHHERHRDELVKAVKALGGQPVAAKSDKEYATQLNVAKLKNQADVLRLALGLERGAANAYLGLIPSLGTNYHQIAGRMAGDEAFHVAVLGGALGEPIPTQGLMFGG